MWVCAAQSRCRSSLCRNSVRLGTVRKAARWPVRTDQKIVWRSARGAIRRATLGCMRCGHLLIIIDSRRSSVKFPTATQDFDPALDSLRLEMFLAGERTACAILCFASCQVRRLGFIKKPHSWRYRLDLQELIIHRDAALVDLRLCCAGQANLPRVCAARAKELPGVCVSSVQR